jgi:hypothetical protein
VRSPDHARPIEITGVPHGWITHQADCPGTEVWVIAGGRELAVSANGDAATIALTKRILGIR